MNSMDQRMRDGSYHLLHRSNLDVRGEVKRCLKALNEKQTSSVDESSGKDKLLAEHSRVAEEALQGWDQAETEAAFLKQKLTKMAADVATLEKENSSLRYELAVLEEELQSRGEENERQSLAMAKRVSELEAELHRLRGILRRRHPLKTPIALTLTNPSCLSSLEEEKMALSEALERKTRELDVAWSLCSRTSSKLSRAETELENWRREKRSGDLGLMSDFLEMERSVCLESSVSSSAQARPEARPETEAAVRKLVSAIDSVKMGNGDGEIKLSLSCESAELIEVLQGLGQACNGFLERGSDLESFVLTLAVSTEWITSRFSVADRKSNILPATNQELEISTATEKLAECQETIFNLGKQLRALAASKDAPSLDCDVSSGVGRTALVDWILADYEKRPDGEPVDGAAGKDVKNLNDSGEKKGLPGPIIMAQKRPKRGVGSMLRRLLMRRKEKGARKVVALHPLSL